MLNLIYLNYVILYKIFLIVNMEKFLDMVVFKVVNLGVVLEDFM